MASGELKERKARKHNFTVSEIAVLTEKVEGNLTVLQSKFTNSVTNQRKNKIWCEMTTAVNSAGGKPNDDGGEQGKEEEHALIIIIIIIAFIYTRLFEIRTA